MTTSNALLNAEVLATLRGISFVSVSQFNTTIDGTTDNTAAWTNAALLAKNIYAPAGTHIISAWINLKSNVTVFGEGAQTILKVATGTYVSGQQFFNIAGKDSVTVRDLTFEGNKGNIGTTHLPMNTIFQSTNVSFLNNRFQNCEGICLNVSTNCDDLTVVGNKFINCGGNRNNSDGYRKQAIAFTNSAGNSANRVKIHHNTFVGQGLDSISMSRCFDVSIVGNVWQGCYTAIYNGSGSPSGDITISGNTVRDTSSAGGPNNPNAFDLSQITNATISGNTIDTVDAVGIGVFANSSNFTVVGNTIINPCQNVASWNGGIAIGGTGSASNVSNIVVAGNNIIDTNGTALMPFGVVLASDVTNVYLGQNNVRNPLTSKYGAFPVLTGVTGHVVALTSNSGITSTVFIHDVDVVAGLQTSWRATNTLVGYQVNGVQVAGAQITGYGTPTGNSRTASFNGASATLAQTSAQLAQLIIDLKTHGLLGA